MNELQQELFEKQLLSLAKGMEYPRTPDIAGSVMTRLLTSPSPLGSPTGVLRKGVRDEGYPRFTSKRLAWSLTIIFILCGSLMLIPPVRAAVIEFIQIGVVRIFPAEPTPLPPTNQQFAPTAVSSTMIPVTITPGLTSEPLLPLLERFAGEMSLEEAQQAAEYPILLPSYPPDLGLPDRVFVQEAEGKMTILVWIDPQQPNEVLMSLHFLPAGSWVIKKIEPMQIQETTVNGQRAIWAIGPYPILYSNGDVDYEMRLIDGHVLIWADRDVTYRLETGLSLEEAVKIAESLEPIR
jgi:hypothetical protein